MYSIQLRANKSVKASAAQQPNQKVGVNKAANASKGSISKSYQNVNKFSAEAQGAQMYAGEKKESIADISDAAKASEKTSETSAGTAPNTNISITNKNVNRPRP